PCRTDADKSHSAPSGLLGATSTVRVVGCAACAWCLGLPRCWRKRGSSRRTPLAGAIAVPPEQLDSPEEEMTERQDDRGACVVIQVSRFFLWEGRGMGPDPLTRRRLLTGWSADASGADRVTPVGRRSDELRRLVRKEGFEPSPSCPDRFLRPARLPIPPLPRGGRDQGVTDKRV